MVSRAMMYRHLFFHLLINIQVVLDLSAGHGGHVCRLGFFKEAEGSKVRVQPGKLCETLSQKVKRAEDVVCGSLLDLVLSTKKKKPANIYEKIICGDTSLHFSWVHMPKQRCRVLES